MTDIKHTNAALIAAAPDLLDALVGAEAEMRRLGHVVRYLDDNGEHFEGSWTNDGEYMPLNPAWENAVAAIAKAKKKNEQKGKHHENTG